MNLLVLIGVIACSTPEAPAPVAPATPPVPAAPAAPAAPEAPAGPVVPEKGVYFKAPLDGATVTSPVKVQMGVAGMEVKPAGELVENTGHHHIIIDAEAPAQGTVVPKDEQHIHYGDGSTETELTLTPGPHTLTLQFADGTHQSYGPDWSAKISITVEGEAAPAAADGAAPAPATTTGHEGHKH